MGRPAGLAASSWLAQRLAKAEAERVSGRVKKYPECFTRLVVSLGRTEGQGDFLALVQVLHHHVQVHLLRDGLPGPHGGLVHIHLLERDAVAAVAGADVEPIAFVLDSQPKSSL